LFQEKLIKDLKKLPLFPIINYSPHKKPKRDNEGVLTNQKLYSAIFKILKWSHNQLFSPQEDKKRQQGSFDKPKALFCYFQNSQVVADPFIALALFSLPLASSTKTGSILALEPHCLTKIFK
jgi:hypothetical protein